MATEKKDQLALDIIARNNSLKSDRGLFDTLWQQISDYVMPRKSNIAAKKTEDFDPDLYNMVATRSNEVLAAGQMDYLMSGDWFAYDPGTNNDDDDAKRWCQRATETVKKLFSQSNLYVEAHEMFLDRGGFGTASLFMRRGKKERFNFKKFDVGTFSVLEDADGIVDTFFREFELTARQAYQEFGDEAGKCVVEAVKSSKPTDMEKKFTFIHAVYPRADEKRQKKKKDGPNKAVASVHVNVKDQCTCRNEGFDTFPLSVTRFLTWGDTPYGYSPSFEALPTIRQVNFIEKNMDALSEIAAWPRVFIPDNLAGDIDMRAGGVTEFDPNNANAKPYEWGTQGRYDIGKDRIEQKNEAIREAYHYDLFMMLKSLEDKERTAYEISQRLAEKVAMFSPTFRRSEREIFTPLLTWAFQQAYESDMLGEPPESMLTQGTDGQPVFVYPEITLTSKLAMAVKAAENNAFAQLVNFLAPLAEMNPSILDNWDMDKASRGFGKNLSVPSSWERPMQEVEEIRNARAQAQEQAAAAEQAPAMAKAAADISKASPSVRKAVIGQ
jgi:hypothetical protein